MKVSRRTFLKLAGASAASVAVSQTPWRAPELRALAEAEDDGINPTPSGESWVNSVCLQCQAGCGIRVRVVDGRAVKIEGNPDYPLNQGRLCPKGQAGLQVLYDPDRIKGPMVRQGSRGSGQWQRISWPEALAVVVDRLGGLRSSGEPHTLVVLGGRYQGQMEPLMGRFLEAYGSPNHMVQSWIGSQSTIAAHYLTQGIEGFVGYDLANVNYLISFGASFAEAWRPTVQVQGLYAQMRRGRPGRRAKIVQVDPRYSVSASKADEWIAPRPGTDGALALGLAHVLIKENLYDRSFVATQTFGFDDWEDGGTKRRGFRSLVLEKYSPQVVAEITGVSEQTIVRLAREMAANGPALAVGERGSGGQSNGVYNRMAIHALNALLGSFEGKGGVVAQRTPPLSSWAPALQDDMARRGLSQPRIDGARGPRFPFAPGVSQVLPEAIRRSDPYPVKALFLYYANPLYSRPDTDRFYEAVAQVPFIVSFSPFYDESTAQADLILPDSTYLERLQDDLPLDLGGRALFGLRQPVVEPLYDTANTGDVLIQIAKGLGGTMAASFPWPSFEEAIKGRARGLFEARRGSVMAATFDQFWAKMKEQGGWWEVATDGVGAPQLFQTPSGHFELYSQLLRQNLERLAGIEAPKKGVSSEQALEAILKGLGIVARGDEVYLPHFEPPRFVGEEDEYPFVLNTYKPMTMAQGWGANQPWLQEIYGLQVRRRWDAWVEINPEMAHELHIGDGDAVWVESPLGKIKLRAKLFDGVRPDVVNIPHGQGHTAFGRWARDRGANPNQIMANEYDSLSGVAAWSSTRVKIYKA